MSSSNHSRRGGGDRKIGRNHDKCLRYRNSNRLLKNKIRKLGKYCRYHPHDKQALARLQELV